MLTLQWIRTDDFQIVSISFHSTWLLNSDTNVYEQSSPLTTSWRIWTQIPTFSSLAFIVDVMVVGLINWKEGAALFGYCAGNFTSILTRWLLQCTDTVQLLSAASICKGQSDNCSRDKPQRTSTYKWVLSALSFWNLQRWRETLQRQMNLEDVDHSFSRLGF